MVNHRHVVFTMDEGLRTIFQKHRHLLKPLMDEAVRIIQEWFKKKFVPPQFNCEKCGVPRVL